MIQGLLQLKSQHIEETAALLARNFKFNNPVWSKFELDQKILQEFFVKEIKTHLESQERIRVETQQNIVMSVVYVHEGKIIAVGMNIELHDYLKMCNEPGESEMLKEFQGIEKHGKQMFKDAKIDTFAKNKHLYGTWIAIDEAVTPQIKKQFKNQALFSTYITYRKQGIDSILLRASSPKSAHLYSALGAKALSQSQIEVKGEKMDLILMQLELNDPVFNKIVQSGKL